MEIDDLELLKTKSIDELSEASDKLSGDMLYRSNTGNLETVPMNFLQQMVETDFKGTISPTDPAPTVEGSYKPKTSSKDNIDIDPINYGTLYTNAGNLRAKAGYDTLFYFNGTTWSKSEVEMPKIDVTPVFDPTNKDDAQGGKQIADALKEVIIFKGSDVAKLNKTDSYNSDNSEKDFLLNNVNDKLSSVNYFISDFIEVHSGLRYYTTLGSNLPAICVYDGDKNFLIGKNSTELQNTNNSYQERLLSDDFNILNAKFVRISSAKDFAIKVTYDENVVIPDETISTLDYNSDLAINSKAIKPIADAINNSSIQGVMKDMELINNYTPYIELADSFVRGFWSDDVTAPNNTISITTRNSDYSFTASTTGFTNNQKTAIAVYNGTNYTPIRVLKVNTVTGLFTTLDKLPTNLVNFQVLMGDGIHLSRHGYKAMGEWLANSLKFKSVQRKNKVFGVYGFDPNLATYEKDFIINGVTVLEIVKLPNTVSGGWIDQANGITGTFENQPANSANFISSKLAKKWQMNQNISGTGGKFTIETSVNGYFKMICGCDYRDGVSSGDVKIKVTDNNGVVLLEKIGNIGLQDIKVNLTQDIESITVEFSLISSVTTIFTIDQIEVFKTYLDDVSFLKSTDKVMFLCDSWGCFPNLENGESPELRPDGSSLQGLSYFPKKAQEIIGFTMYNFSRGNQTSEWGRYWVEELIKRCPLKPDYCVVNFFINDCNSVVNIAGNTPSNYDFSPTDPYTYQMSDAGGVFASTSKERHLSNMQYICATLRRYDITPIVIGYPQLGNVNIEFAQRNTLFLKEF